MNKNSLLEFIAESPEPPTKREIAQAFSVRGQGKSKLTRILKELEADGQITRQSGGYIVQSTLPDVSVLKIVDISIDGDVYARPDKWDEAIKGKAPAIIMKPDKKGHPAFTVGDSVLARLSEQDDGSYMASTIKRLERTPEDTILGLIVKTDKGYVLQPTDKKARRDFPVQKKNLGNAQEGDLVAAKIITSDYESFRKKAEVKEVIGQQTDPKAFSLIAIHENGLRHEFSEAVLKETENMAVPDLGDRKDLRDIPLVTIDGADARDFDDAVYCEETENGFHLIVAIADVAHYVRPGSALDDEAYARGNSTYFPDRVVPMLPEALSNGLCSLRPDEERACMAMHMWIDKNGKLENYEVVRGLMKSKARLTYEQVQEARNGNPDDAIKPLMDDVITPLFKAYEVLNTAKQDRGALHLRAPERRIIVNNEGDMTGVSTREQLDSHKLIEEFMIMANVAAASALEKQQAPCVYRVHERPDALKLESIRDFVEAFGLSLPKGQVTGPKQLNQILDQADKLPHAQLIHQVVLRSMSQAHYTTNNKGHFGLSLDRYAHFTSPIRRYSDLLVHRSLIEAFNLGQDGLDQAQKATLEERAEHISATERLSMTAERSTVDRFTAAYLSDKVGAEFSGKITGLTKAGLFVVLNETGADTFLPRRLLPDDFYIHDEKQHALVGRKKGRIYRLGAAIDVRLKESDGLSGNVIVEPINDKSAELEGVSFKPTKQRPTARQRKHKKNSGYRR